MKFGHRSQRLRLAGFSRMSCNPAGPAMIADVDRGGEEGGARYESRSMKIAV